MAKRDPQVFAWNCKDGVLTIEGRKDSDMAGIKRVYSIETYPEAIVQSIQDAGFKAVFQQRTSQVEGDWPKLEAWDALDEMFKAGDWEKEGGTRGAPVIAAWIEAAAESKKVTPGEFQAAWSKYEKPQRDAIKAKCEKTFAKRIEEIKAARKDAVDLSDMM